MSAPHTRRGLLRAAVLVLLVAVAFSLLSTAEAKPKKEKNKDDFKPCGGAKACLGTQRLDRIRRRSGLKHKTVEEIAQTLDEDGDLVSTSNLIQIQCVSCVQQTCLCAPCVGGTATRLWYQKQ